MPAAVVALVLNFLLGFDIWSMIAGMAVLFCFSSYNTRFPAGGFGRRRFEMGLIMGAMLGLAVG